MISALFSKCFPFLPFFQTEQSEHHILEIKDSHYYLTPKTQHTHTVIFMHGLGDSPKSFLTLIPSFFNQFTKIVLLQAPSRKVSINNGQASSSWFDIRGFDSELDLTKLISMNELEESAEFINKILDKECQLIKSEKVFIGGFSQGCILALYQSMNYEQKLAGIFGFSGFLLPNLDLNGINKDTPKFLSHGEYDYMIPWFVAKKSYNRLNEHNARIQLDKQLDHSISQKQIEWVTKWISDIQNK